MNELTEFTELGDIICHQVPLGEGVSGFVYRSGRGRYHVFVNDTLSPEAVTKTLLHEMYHIKHDMPVAHKIGLDSFLSDMETAANDFARLTMKQKINAI